MSDAGDDGPLDRSAQIIHARRPGVRRESATRRPRHRWGRWVACAAALAVVAAIAVHLADLAAHDPSSGLPRYAGEEQWSNPVLDENRPTVVFVYASQIGGTASWGSYCYSTPAARVVSQTANSVRVAVAKYARPSLGVCDGMGRGLSRLAVTLTQPLGTRTLVDAYDGAARQVLDPATVLKPSYLPAGYTGGQPTSAGQPPGVAERHYQRPGADLIITVGPAPLQASAPHIAEYTTVRGHPATVSYSPGFEQDLLVSWNEDATYAAQLYQASSYDKTHPALTTEELVRIANNLH